MFDKQEGRILGNIHLESNDEVVALGYFEVASVQEVQIDYSSNDFDSKFNPIFPSICSFEPPAENERSQVMVNP